ncbi:L,D-transpeptidase [Methylobacterium gossipiicola]|uniref:Lipoprotein-anchoring transpeptidase ErfK/SrfK n=1 Tax=Methylobacterium gossipiicola TaxID=582675 RepID=A0A1I2TFE0_9HYPH|nr:L,D-transpeptidase [Methylobacterium gossipiicola]SFG63634.1 Lipoprotein-anchoring transpeptidase ErfK/SrfK [Methylobacterium gossipiicola]
MPIRNAILGLVLIAPLAACNARGPVNVAAEDAAWYTGTLPDKPFDVPLVDKTRLDPKYRRQVVRYTGPEKPGTIVVDIDNRLIALVQEDGTALQYGVGVGKAGFSWKGEARIARKGVWPDWSPTPTMVSLNPDLPRTRKGGLDNPLGARALYLYQGNRDTLFRIHGTNEPWSIGEQLSSGCVRMLNEDIVDLYERVPVGTQVLVKRNGKYRA